MQGTPVLSPVVSLLRSRAVMVAALALGLTVAGSLACPSGLDSTTCDPRVPPILDAVQTFGLAVIVKMAAEDVAGKLAGGLARRGPNVEVVGVKTETSPEPAG